PVTKAPPQHDAYGVSDERGIDQGAEEGTEKKLEPEADPGTPSGGELQLLDGEDNGPVEPEHVFLKRCFFTRVAESEQVQRPDDQLRCECDEEHRGKRPACCRP